MVGGREIKQTPEQFSRKRIWKWAVERRAALYRAADVSDGAEGRAALSYSKPNVENAAAAFRPGWHAAACKCQRWLVWNQLSAEGRVAEQPWPGQSSIRPWIHLETVQTSSGNYFYSPFTDLFFFFFFFSGDAFHRIVLPTKHSAYFSPKHNRSVGIVDIFFTALPRFTQSLLPGRKPPTAPRSTPCLCLRSRLHGGQRVRSWRNRQRRSQNGDGSGVRQRPQDHRHYRGVLWSRKLRHVRQSLQVRRWGGCWIKRGVFLVFVVCWSDLVVVVTQPLTW